jgi:hypothetical protein
MTGNGIIYPKEDELLFFFLVGRGGRHDGSQEQHFCFTTRQVACEIDGERIMSSMVMGGARGWGRQARQKEVCTVAACHRKKMHGASSSSKKMTEDQVRQLVVCCCSLACVGERVSEGLEMFGE